MTMRRAIELRMSRWLGLSVLTFATMVVARPSPAFSPASGDFAREFTTEIRVMTYNNQKNFLKVASTDDEYQRLITSINPDIIAFQEMDDTLGTPSSIATQIKTRLQTYFPSETWTAQAGISDGFNVNALASRYPMSLKITDTIPAAGLRGVSAALIDLPNATYGTTDFYVMCVHLKSGGATADNQDRQQEADAVINWQRDARTAGGNITLASGTPMLLLGDMNFGYQDQGDVSPYHGSLTVVNGDIYNTATYGVDSKPDWDGSDNSDAAPYDHVNSNPRTQPATSPDSRFDRFIYTDSVLRVRHRFVVNTQTMSASARTAAGLIATDTTNASDHLPAIVDFALGADPNPPGQILINEFSFNDAASPDVRTFIELKNVGGRTINLEAPQAYSLKQSVSGALATTIPGTENEFTGFNLTGTIPPGGLFVMYDGSTSGDSSGIKSLIQSRLSSLQYQDLGSGFGLTNTGNSGFALVTVGKYDTAGTTDTLVEAFAYGCSSTASNRYFRTNSGNNLLITLSPNQQTVFAGGVDTTVSRKSNSTQPNNFTQWIIPDTETVGLENATPTATVDEWKLY
ncbi:MAG: endonuclease/exonuclease/phosphatase family protein [Candidatus Sumerlaeaceae bacterium]|nr:endonuclease/exonuclease/phosphatase family protein [Candidatus Sumerlaeaceae bacterium]